MVLNGSELCRPVIGLTAYTEQPQSGVFGPVGVRLVELPGRTFVVGVQWHPEQDPVDDRLFAALVAACARNRMRNFTQWRTGEAQSRELDETDVERPHNVGDVEFTDSADHAYHYQRQDLSPRRARDQVIGALRGANDVEVVVLSAGSRENLLRTHARYFRSLAELASRTG